MIVNKRLTGVMHIKVRIQDVEIALAKILKLSSNGLPARKKICGMQIMPCLSCPQDSFGPSISPCVSFLRERPSRNPGIAPARCSARECRLSFSLSILTPW